MYHRLTLHQIGIIGRNPPEYIDIYAVGRRKIILELGRCDEIVDVGRIIQIILIRLQFGGESEGVAFRETAFELVDLTFELSGQIGYPGVQCVNLRNQSGAIGRAFDGYNAPKSLGSSIGADEVACLFHSLLKIRQPV